LPMAQRECSLNLLPFSKLVDAIRLKERTIVSTVKLSEKPGILFHAFVSSLLTCTLFVGKYIEIVLSVTSSVYSADLIS